MLSLMFSFDDCAQNLLSLSSVVMKCAHDTNILLTNKAHFKEVIVVGKISTWTRAAVS